MAKKKTTAVPKPPKSPRSSGDAPVMCLRMTFLQGLHLAPIGLMLAVATQFGGSFKVHHEECVGTSEKPMDLAALGVKPQVAVKVEVLGKRRRDIVDTFIAISAGKWHIEITSPDLF